jgi:exopolysaccharide production protein ExoZ
MPVILSIQILRVVAAIGVVLVHAGDALNYWGHTHVTWTLRGNAGVDLFFVISGFVMVYISWQHFGECSASISFFKRRIIRIVPLYWLVTTIYVLLGHHPLHSIVTSYLFIPDISGPANIETIHPIVPQGWTLRYEMFFYLLFGVCIMFPRRYAVPSLCVMLAVLVLAGVPLYGNPITLEFAVGAIIGVAYCKNVRFETTVSFALIVLGLYLLVVPIGENYRLVAFGLPSGLMVAGATLGRQLGHGRFSDHVVLLGDASYALYLIHAPIVRGVATAMRDGFGINLSNTRLAYISLAITVSISLALATHIYIERPLLEYLKQHASWSFMKIAWFKKAQQTPAISRGQADA